MAVIKFNFATGMYERTKITTTVETVNPVTVFNDLIKSQPDTGSMVELGYGAKLLHPNRLAIYFPPANRDWSNAIIYAIAEFLTMFPKSYIRGAEHSESTAGPLYDLSIQLG